MVPLLMLLWVTSVSTLKSQLHPQLLADFSKCISSCVVFMRKTNQQACSSCPTVSSSHQVLKSASGMLSRKTTDSMQSNAFCQSLSSERCHEFEPYADLHLHHIHNHQLYYDDKSSCQMQLDRNRRKVSSPLQVRSGPVSKPSVLIL